MIASFTDLSHFATFRCAPFSFNWYQRQVVLHAINGFKSMMPHAKISRCIRFGCLCMICLCMTNLGDVDTKNNPSVMVANSPKLNYCILVNVII